MPEASDYIESRTPITDGDVSGDEILLVSKNGSSRSLTVAQVAAQAEGGVTSVNGQTGSVTVDVTTREFNRAWSSELLFDKNEIAYEINTLSGDLNYTVAESGHLENQFSSAVQRIVTDGTRTVTFSGFDFVLGDIQSGSVPDAGTYLVLFLYWNGIATVNWTIPSLEVANLTPLTTPANFTATPDGSTVMDLAWDAVANASSYEIQYSTTSGGGPWSPSVPISVAAGSTTYEHTGLSAGTTYHYRIRAIGDGVGFSNSNYAVTAQTTGDAGDTDAPVATFYPVDSATDVPVNQVITITMDEVIRDADGVTAINNSNIADYLTIKEDNSSGADISFTASISGLVITITPSIMWGDTQAVYVAISGIEDVNGNEASVQSATFTTSDFTLMQGNYVLDSGLDLDPVIEANDGIWEIEATIKDHPMAGMRSFAQKYGAADANKSLLIRSNEADWEFRIYNLSGSLSLSYRSIRWPNAITSGSHRYQFRYKGNVDTNNGLDRVDLYIDGVIFTTGKTLEVHGTATWPFQIRANSEPLKLLGTSVGQVKDIKITSNTESVTELDIPIVRTGEDVSGNNRDCSWV